MALGLAELKPPITRSTPESRVKRGISWSSERWVRATTMSGVASLRMTGTQRATASKGGTTSIRPMSLRSTYWASAPSKRPMTATRTPPRSKTA
ncbi:hypothetical protein D3C86_1233540 [compost metagenome]